MLNFKKPTNSNGVLYLYLIILILLFLVGSVLIEPTTVALPSSNKQDFSVLEPYITAEMKKNNVPGLSMVIFNDREIEYSQGFGVKNTTTGEPVDEDTIFEAASFSKTLTAYAALILVEKGSFLG